MKLTQRLLWGSLALGVAAAIWLPSVHLFFRNCESSFRCANGVSLKARELAARHLLMWNDPKLKNSEVERMRRSNAEWDFMGRSFLVWSLAEMGLREPSQKAAYLKVMDQIIEETIQLE